MTPRSTAVRLVRVVVATLLSATLLLSACTDGRRAVTGSYTARAEDGSSVSLVLKHDGKGAWTHGGFTATLTWERRDEHGLWLHTRDGGVLRGRFENGAITLDLPGGETFIFTKH